MPWHDQCPTGEEVRLPDGSKEIGAYNKVVIGHVPFGPQACLCQSGILLHLKRGLSGSPGNPNTISAHPGERGQKVQNKPKEQRLGRKHQAKLLNKTLGTAPTCWALGPPLRNTFSNKSSLKVVVVHLYTFSGKPLIQLHHNTVVYI